MVVVVVVAKQRVKQAAKDAATAAMIAVVVAASETELKHVSAAKEVVESAASSTSTPSATPEELLENVCGVPKVEFKALEAPASRSVGNCRKAKGIGGNVSGREQSHEMMLAVMLCLQIPPYIS